MSRTENQKKGERVSIKERRKKSLAAALKSMVQENRNPLILFCGIVAALLVILVSILTLQMPALPVCVIVLLEAGLAVCLHDVPIWLHGLVIIAQIAAGAFCGAAVFMALCAAIYAAGIFMLRLIR